MRELADRIAELMLTIEDLDEQRRILTEQVKEMKARKDMLTAELLHMIRRGT